MELRLARPDEHAEVGRITAAAYVGAGFMPATDPYVARLEDAATRAAEAELWVAVEDEELLGSVTFCPEGSPWRELGRPGEGEFRMLAVSPAAQGRGAGAALVGHCVQRSRDLGYTGMRISSLPVMRDAHRIYARFGFERTPEDDWSPTPGVVLQAYAVSLR